MNRLERTSRARPDLRRADVGRLRHPPSQNLPRHLHDHAFAAIVLSGGYVEAGDTGRYWMEPGDVLLHRAWECHLDRIDGRGAEVLVLYVADADVMRLAGRIADPDAIVRLAEHDRPAAVRLMLESLISKSAPSSDWPDLLAHALQVDPGLCLGQWAGERNLHLGSVSRGFGQVFGITPVGYRLVQRTRRAIKAIQHSRAPLRSIAHDCGFSDQAHMNRAIRDLAGTTPMALRRIAP
jgi:AraC-like DNA-binding protein